MVRFGKVWWGLVGFGLVGCGEVRYGLIFILIPQE